MSIFRKKNNIIEPQRPEPSIDSEPDGGCEPCPGEDLFSEKIPCDSVRDATNKINELLQQCSHAEGVSNQYIGAYSHAVGYYNREEENK